MGGDILYRWGNPSNYGISGTQVIESAVHDARWIEDDGRPNGGFLQIFNNCGVGCTGGGPNAVANSTIDGIETPWDDSTNTYLRISGQAFSPASYSTRYECAYSASGQSASDRMSNGNIFVNASAGGGGSGTMYEVDSLGTILWGPTSGGLKGFRYECDFPGIIALEPFMTNTSTTTCFTVTTPSWDCIQNTCVDPGTGQGTYALLSACQNVCNTTAITDVSINKKLIIFPNPTNDIITIKFESKTLQNIDIKIVNSLGQNIFENTISYYIGTLTEKVNLSSFPEGLYFVKITIDNGKSITERIAHIK